MYFPFFFMISLRYVFSKRKRTWRLFQEKTSWEHFLPTPWNRLPRTFCRLPRVRSCTRVYFIHKADFFFYYISCVSVIFSSRVHLFTSLPVSGKSSSNNNTDSDGANLDKQIKITHQTTTPKACKMKTYTFWK